MKYAYSDYINEIYLYFNVNLDNSTPFRYKLIRSVFWIFLFAPILAFTSILYSFFFMFIPRVVCNKISLNEKICVARTFAAESKLNFLKKEGVFFFKEKPFAINERSNLYSIPMFYRIKSFLKSIEYTFKDVFQLATEAVNYFTLSGAVKVFLMYLPRIPHKVNFAAYLNQLICLYNPQVIITGNKEDRFALVEEKLAKSHGIKLVCYPHGLEYAMKLPRGVVGDVFYCYSDASRLHYENLYKDKNQEFLFSPDIIHSLLGKSYQSSNREKRLVFFPESRDKQVNYRIVRSILNCSLPLFLKLHPLDSADHYLSLGINPENIIKSFDEAITGNIVLARKSTVLLEALYSGSESCALLFDDEDYRSYMQLFPSLWDDRIEKLRNISDLVDWLKKLNFEPKSA